ncbi:hypothetical protein [Lelliottia nimipressuralis]|uniref:Uncharacterized protein n=1 Tax=Lelliottia nimipressuralis TaxID=69220 RepID=A0ABD4K5L5_9ENTR|nr:hypothetical protein [Lelliottia nimipressuralis]MBF4177257.1 hypothetical protein [Lelliottia nimipressuralis]
MIAELKRGPLLNSELAKILGIEQIKLIDNARNLFLRARESYEITADAEFIDGAGVRNCLYTLVRFEPDRAKSAFVISKNKGQGGRAELNRKIAKERVKLINSGNYSKEAEKKLCEKYGL